MDDGNPPELNSLGFPIRPNAEVCQNFVRNSAFCKFKAACKYHHPEAMCASHTKSDARGASNAASSSASASVHFNSRGYPIRPGVEACQTYNRTGDCKFASECKYDHSKVFRDEPKGRPSERAVRPARVPSRQEVLEALSRMKLNSRGYPRTTGEECKDYIRLGGVCKRKLVCPFDHPELSPNEITSFAIKLDKEMNCVGLPKHEGAKPCEKFINSKGHCELKSDCPFDHPEDIAQLRAYQNLRRYSRDTTKDHEEASDDSSDEDDSVDEDGFRKVQRKPRPAKKVQTKPLYLEIDPKTSDSDPWSEDTRTTFNSAGFPVRIGTEVCQEFVNSFGHCDFGARCHFDHPEWVIEMAKIEEEKKRKKEAAAREKKESEAAIRAVKTFEDRRTPQGDEGRPKLDSTKSQNQSPTSIPQQLQPPQSQTSKEVKDKPDLLRLIALEDERLQKEAMESQQKLDQLSREQPDARPLHDAARNILTAASSGHDPARRSQEVTGDIQEREITTANKKNAEEEARQAALAEERRKMEVEREERMKMLREEEERVQQQLAQARERIMEEERKRKEAEQAALEAARLLQEAKRIAEESAARAAEEERKRLALEAARISQEEAMQQEIQRRVQAEAFRLYENRLLAEAKIQAETKAAQLAKEDPEALLEAALKAAKKESERMKRESMAASSAVAALEKAKKEADALKRKKELALARSQVQAQAQAATALQKQEKEKKREGEVVATSNATVTANSATQSSKIERATASLARLGLPPNACGGLYLRGQCMHPSACKYLHSFPIPSGEAVQQPAQQVNNIENAEMVASPTLAAPTKTEKARAKAAAKAEKSVQPVLTEATEKVDEKPVRQPTTSSSPRVIDVPAVPMKAAPTDKKVPRKQLKAQLGLPANACSSLYLDGHCPKIGRGCPYEHNYPIPLSAAGKSVTTKLASIAQPAAGMVVTQPAVGTSSSLPMKMPSEVMAKLGLAADACQDLYLRGKCLQAGKCQDIHTYSFPAKALLAMVMQEAAIPAASSSSAAPVEAKPPRQKQSGKSSVSTSGDSKSSSPVRPQSAASDKSTSKAVLPSSVGSGVDVAPPIDKGSPLGDNAQAATTKPIEAPSIRTETIGSEVTKLGQMDGIDDAACLKSDVARFASSCGVEDAISSMLLQGAVQSGAKRKLIEANLSEFAKVLNKLGMPMSEVRVLCQKVFELKKTSLRAAGT